MGIIFLALTMILIVIQDKEGVPRSSCVKKKLYIYIYIYIYIFII